MMTSIDRHQLQMQHPSFPRQRDSMKHSASMLCWYIIDSHLLAPVAGAFHTITFADSYTYNKIKILSFSFKITHQS
jgi:hypothetical protein